MNALKSWCTMKSEDSFGAKEAEIHTLRGYSESVWKTCYKITLGFKILHHTSLIFINSYAVFTYKITELLTLL